MITRTKLATMKEKELQRDVLVPLFEALGFHDVEVHQGTTEAGKDLVMWRPGDLGERLNYAVVAKAKPISGKAAGKSSAAEVRFQIEQAFSSEWYDSKTTQAQRADRCLVICSREIKKEAIAVLLMMTCVRWFIFEKPQNSHSMLSTLILKISFEP